VTILLFSPFLPPFSLLHRPRVVGVLHKVNDCHPSLPFLLFPFPSSPSWLISATCRSGCGHLLFFFSPFFFPPVPPSRCIVAGASRTSFPSPLFFSSLLPPSFFSPFADIEEEWMKRLARDPAFFPLPFFPLFLSLLRRARTVQPIGVEVRKRGTGGTALRPAFVFILFSSSSSFQLKGGKERIK